MPGQSVPSSLKSPCSEDVSGRVGGTNPHPGTSLTFPLDLELPVTSHSREGEGGRLRVGYNGEIQ